MTLHDVSSVWIYLVILLVLLVVKSPETKAQETFGGVLISNAV